MAPHASIQLKARIITKLEDGWSLAAVANHFNISKSTAYRINRRWIQDQTLNRKEGSGRPKISTADEDRALLLELEQNPFLNAKEARILSRFPGRKTTTWQRLQDYPLKCRMAANKTNLTAEQRQARLIFALNHINREQNFWDRVIFTDEKIFQSSKKGKIKVYRPNNARFDPRYVNHFRAAGHFSVNVWGWFSSRGMGVAWRIHGRFVGQTYVDILDNVMLPSVQHLYPENDFIYQQDNCPIHTSNIAMQWFQNNNIELLQWPSYSPDANPLENVWGLMTKKLYQRNFMPRNAEDLWNSIEEVWEELSQRDDFLAPFMQINRRLQAIIDADGHMTRY